MHPSLQVLRLEVNWSTKNFLPAVHCGQRNMVSDIQQLFDEQNITIS